MILSRQRTTKALIRLPGCAGWSAPLLLANGINNLYITVEENEMFDFRGLRLDWFRLQVIGISQYFQLSHSVKLDLIVQAACLLVEKGRILLFFFLHSIKLCTSHLLPFPPLTRNSRYYDFSSITALLKALHLKTFTCSLSQNATAVTLFFKEITNPRLPLHCWDDWKGIAL